MGDSIPGTGSSMKTREISSKGRNTNKKEKFLIDVERGLKGSVSSVHQRNL